MTNNKKVYVFIYHMEYSEPPLIQVFNDLPALMNRLEMIRLHDNFTTDERVEILCEEVVTQEMSLERFNHAKSYHSKKEDNSTDNE